MGARQAIAPRILRRLHPVPGCMTAVEVARELSYEGLGGRRRPHILLNMVVTVDGHVTIDGRSGSLGNRADRELFLALRTTVDAVMVGAGTARTERYGALIRDPELRAERVRRGLDPVPLAIIPTRRLDLPVELPLLSDPDSRVLIITSSAEEIKGAAARVEYLRGPPGASPDMTATMEALAERGVRSILCEGGPHLNSTLLPAGLVDELHVSFSPMLAGGDALTMVSGASLPGPAQLTLLWLFESEGHLFARYAVGHPGSDGGT